MEYEYSLAAYPLVFHQHIFSELAKNLSCNCQFNVKISPLHILKGSSCLSCLSVLSCFPFHTSLNLHTTGRSDMSSSRDHIPFIFSQECTLRDCLCSCLYIKQNARLSSESASCSDTQSPQ